ncbi:unnamed protein product [Anisakis simplex]|uniref:Transcriptional regulator n=1 Tax=Anisakis simplex TaxID=6269 RepID=A0A0M3JP73_ANISI|nr:unnamed protein product [Anisakis simplex]
MNDAKLERLRGRYEYVRAAVNSRSVEVPRETTDS